MISSDATRDQIEAVVARGIEVGYASVPAQIELLRLASAIGMDAQVPATSGWESTR